MQNTELQPYEVFYINFCSRNTFETEYMDHLNLMKSWLKTEQAVIKLKLSKPPPTGIEKYQNLQQKC